MALERSETSKCNVASRWDAVFWGVVVAQGNESNAAQPRIKATRERQSIVRALCAPQSIVHDSGVYAAPCLVVALKMEPQLLLSAPSKRWKDVLVLKTILQMETVLSSDGQSQRFVIRGIQPKVGLFLDRILPYFPWVSKVVQ